ncbi:MAG: SLC13 family permease [Desulfobacterales bacterium]|nr:SLC13 family permease [Desulfobacterales bacterium]
MEWQMWFTILSVVLMFVLLAKTNIGPEWICLGVMTLLVGVGILSPSDAAAGLSNKGMLAVAILFVVAAAIQSTGAIRLITFFLSGRVKSRASAQFRMMLPITFLSAFLNNTPVVAIFIPAISAWAKRIKIPVSKLMIPLSYSAIIGGTCTLIGTSTNLVVSGIFTKETGIQIGFFEIAKAGVPCAIVMFASIFLLSRWLLPDRPSAIEQMGDPKEYTLEMMVNSSSGLDGKTLREAEFTEENNINLIKIIRDGRSIPSINPERRIRNEDRLVFTGGADTVSELQQTKGLTPVMDKIFNITTPRPERCLVEVVISPTNQLIGRSIVGGHFRQLYNSVVVAVSRAGSQIKGTIGDIVLQSGDTLLLETHPSFYEQQRNSRDFYLISQLEETPEPRYNKAILAIVILCGMVLSASIFKINMFQAALIASAILLITRCITPVQALKSIDTQVLLVIIAAFGIGKAMQTTGAAEFIATGIIGLARDNPWLILSALYLTTSILTEMVTNNAAALILFPIAMATAQKLGVNVTPFIFAIMLGASASFATPIGYQTNMMVYGPGGYRFSDFLKIGVPLNLIMWITASILIPRIWPF